MGCTLRPVCRHTSNWLLISILMCVYWKHKPHESRLHRQPRFSSLQKVVNTKWKDQMLLCGSVHCTMLIIAETFHHWQILLDLNFPPQFVYQTLLSEGLGTRPGQQSHFYMVRLWFPGCIDWERIWEMRANTDIHRVRSFAQCASLVQIFLTVLGSEVCWLPS